LVFGGTLANAAPPDHDHAAKSPIKHVIVIVGENRSFDHIFATYKPKPGQHVDNLLSKHIVNEDGTPGSKYWLATQYSADITGATEFQLSPSNKKAYGNLPAPLNGGPTDVCKNSGICSLADAEASENGLPDATYYGFLTTGGSGLTSTLTHDMIAHCSHSDSTRPWRT
jgi:phospholipase C